MTPSSPTAANLPTLPLGDDTDVHVGDELYINGFPGVITNSPVFNPKSKLYPALTQGAFNASRTTITGVPYIQAQAPSYGGNSGGPVFDERGRVVGTLIAGTGDDARCRSSARCARCIRRIRTSPRTSATPARPSRLDRTGRRRRRHDGPPRPAGGPPPATASSGQGRLQGDGVFREAGTTTRKAAGRRDVWPPSHGVGRQPWPTRGNRKPRSPDVCREPGFRLLLWSCGGRYWD